jgi:deazaflavin-dependent oxidoreductase (nitroreductase family)
MADYVPSPTEWVREHVAKYEATDGAEGYELRGMACVIVTHTGSKTGAVRKSPLMRVQHGDRYVLVGSKGGAPEDPLWVRNLRAHPDVTVRDKDRVFDVRARFVTDPSERAEVWKSAVAAFPDYATYQTRTERVIPLFVCEPR